MERCGYFGERLAVKGRKKNAEDILGMDRDTELVSVKTVIPLTLQENKVGKNLSDSQNKYDNFANSKELLEH